MLVLFKGGMWRIAMGQNVRNLGKFVGISALSCLAVGCGPQESESSITRSQKQSAESSGAQSKDQVGQSAPAAAFESASSLFLEQTEASSEGFGSQSDIGNGQLGAFASSEKVAFFCKQNFRYDSKSKLCISSINAAGPFTKRMQDLCKSKGGGKDACEGSSWNKDLAARLRGTDDCPFGAIWDNSRKVCTEGENAFGPFTIAQVEACRALGAGSACETNRWHRSLVKSAAVPGPAVPALSRKLTAYYTVYSNYLKVSDAVKVFYPPHRSNGCVAFMTEALRQIGFWVPKDQSREGYNVTLVTSAFSAYLGEKGWSRISRAADLLPGDVVFTVADSRWPNVPAHTYMFQRWADQSRGIGLVVDNQDFTHERNIFGYGTYNFSPFWYAMRPAQ